MGMSVVRAAVQTQDVPDAVAIGAYYRSDDYIFNQYTKGLINRLYHIVRKQTLSNKFPDLSRRGRGRAALDIGAGTGAFVANMKDRAGDIIIRPVIGTDSNRIRHILGEPQPARQTFPYLKSSCETV